MGCSALIDCVCRGDIKSVEILLKYGAPLKNASGQWWSCLHCAVANTQEAIILFLLHEGLVDLNTPVNDDNTSVMHFAAQECLNGPLLRVLVSNGGKFNTPISKGGYTPLHIACSVSNMQVIDVVMETGLKHLWRAYAKKGVAPVVAALHYRQIDLVQVLLNKPPYATCEELQLSWYDTDSNGMNCLHVAVFEGYEKEAIAMLEGGIKPHKWNGSTLLHLAAIAGGRALGCLEYLLRNCTTDVLPQWAESSRKDASLSLCAKDEKGYTPLHNACIGNCHASAQLLLRFGADVNAHSPTRETPLHLSVKCAAEHCIRLLVKAGADLALLDEESQTACDIAVNNEFSYLVQLLQPSVE